MASILISPPLLPGGEASHSGCPPAPTVDAEKANAPIATWRAKGAFAVPPSFTVRTAVSRADRVTRQGGVGQAHAR